MIVLCYVLYEYVNMCNLYLCCFIWLALIVLMRARVEVDSYDEYQSVSN